jgi:protein TonB
VLVDETGDVAEAHVAQSSGREDCDQSARETVLARWKFKPARLNGINVAWREKVAVSYQLR